MDDGATTAERQPGEVDPVRVATAFATVLDADDLDSLVTMLSDDVVYRIGDAVHRGPDAVVASYRDGSALARTIFEQVTYSHDIVGLVGARTVRIDFADDLAEGGEDFDHHSIQDVEVGRDGRIVAITDRPVEGQRAQLDAFMARHGLTRPESPPT